MLTQIWILAVGIAQLVSASIGSKLKMCLLSFLQLEYYQNETSVRFDFHSDVQQCKSISCVVCKENEVFKSDATLTQLASRVIAASDIGWYSVH
jgi:hypothetical protein